METITLNYAEVLTYSGENTEPEVEKDHVSVSLNVEAEEVTISRDGETHIYKVLDLLEESTGILELYVVDTVEKIELTMTLCASFTRLENADGVMEFVI